MNIEVTPMIECADEVVIDSGFGEACIGKKKFIEIGKFEYQWFLEFLSREDLFALAEALLFVADHMVTATDAEVSA